MRLSRPAPAVRFALAAVLAAAAAAGKGGDNASLPVATHVDALADFDAPEDVREGLFGDAPEEASSGRQRSAGSQGASGNATRPLERQRPRRKPRKRGATDERIALRDEAFSPSRRHLPPSAEDSKREDGAEDEEIVRVKASSSPHRPLLSPSHEDSGRADRGDDEEGQAEVSADGSIQLAAASPPRQRALGEEAAGKEWPAGGRDQQVVSSWAMIAVFGEWSNKAAQRREYPAILQGLRDALADSLEVCRSAVRIVDMRPSETDIVVDPGSVPPPRHKAPQASLVHRLQLLMRRSTATAARTQTRGLNVTRLRASYEVRIFPEMRVQSATVARKVDQLQIYSKFSELSRLVAASVASYRQDVTTWERVVLDDVGYGACSKLPRPDVSEEDVLDCREEVLLREAREAHKYVIAIAMLLIVLTTCAGSAVFAIKHPSTVPSRMNPLLGPSPG